MSGLCISIAPTTRHRWCACPSSRCIQPPGAHPEVWLRATPGLRFAVSLQSASTLVIVSGLLLEPIPRCISFLFRPSCRFSNPPADQSDHGYSCSQLSFCSLMEACFVFGYSADRADPGHSLIQSLTGYSAGSASLSPIPRVTGGARALRSGIFGCLVPGS